MGKIISTTLGRGIMNARAKGGKALAKGRMKAMGSPGDSGTFGSQKTMNAIGKMQQAKKPTPFTPAGNAKTKAMLTGTMGRRKY